MSQEQLEFKIGEDEEPATVELTEGDNGLEAKIADETPPPAVETEAAAPQQEAKPEEELRERMVYAGRPGMWGDWQKFQAQAARKRREAKEEAQREAQRRQESLARMVEYIALGIASVVLAALIIYGIVLYMRYLR